MRTLRNRLCVLLATLVHRLCRRVVFEPDLAVVAPARPTCVWCAPVRVLQALQCAVSWGAPVHRLRLPFLRKAHWFSSAVLTRSSASRRKRVQAGRTSVIFD